VKAVTTQPKSNSSNENSEFPRTVAPTVTPVAVGLLPENIPRKLNKSPKPTPPRYIDVGAARKQLFFPNRSSPLTSVELPRMKHYKMKENALWTKLFVS
jgi:hypothetical protein